VKPPSIVNCSGVIVDRKELNNYCCKLQISP
jgi:hypothetical protein